MSYKLKTIKFTPSKAQHFLDKHNTHEGQRNIHLPQVKKLSNAMTKGTFSSATIELSQNGTETAVLVNGQHTLSAIVDSGATYELPVITHIVQLESDTDELLYRLDIGKKRTLADMYRVKGLADKFEMSATDLNRFGGALAVIITGMGSSTANIDIDDRLEAMNEWYPYAKTYLSMIEAPTINKPTLMRRDTFSIGLLTCRDCLDMAKGFWPLVATGDGLERYDIREVYRRWLVKTTGEQSRGLARLTYAQTIRYSARAWNAWHDNREIKFLKVISTRGPVIVKGTRFATR